MALTESQLLKVCRITGVSKYDLDYRLTEYVPTAEVETQVGALILEWFPASGTAAGRDFLRVLPMEENFGADIDPSRSRSAIKNEISTLLYITDLMTAAGGSRLVRC
jgi:hypothetical protein